MPFVKLQPLSPEMEALVREVRDALEGAEVGKPVPMPDGLMDRINDQFRAEAIALRRRDWCMETCCRSQTFLAWRCPVADIPRIEEDALRAAFESTMRETFGWQNFTRTTEHGYRVGFIQAAWFACRCGWLTGRSYGVQEDQRG